MDENGWFGIMPALELALKNAKSGSTQPSPVYFTFSQYLMLPTDFALITNMP